MSASSRTTLAASSKWFPLVLIGLGVLMVTAAIAARLFLNTQTEPLSAPIPARVAGFSLSSEATGKAALQEFAQLHGKTFPVISGAKAVYGTGNQVILWTAGTAANSDARKLLEEMRDKIAEGAAAGRSPFEPIGVLKTAGREVYALEGMGQKHFYFQSGKYLVWLAANEDTADQALQEALRFYP